jgi:hypothetical protein
MRFVNGLLNTQGTFLNLAMDKNSPVVVSWRESEAQSASRFVIEGRVPIIARSVKLNLSKVSPGDYWVDITVAGSNGRIVQSRKAIVVR